MVVTADGYDDEAIAAAGFISTPWHVRFREAGLIAPSCALNGNSAPLQSGWVKAPSLYHCAAVLQTERLQRIDHEVEGQGTAQA